MSVRTESAPVVRPGLCQEAAVADKLTQQITEALSKAAAAPDGLPLLAGKTDPGLFPPAAAKPAVQKAQADGLVRVVRTETRGKTTRELYGLTEKGWEFLLAAVNPKQVLEDFVRVLEARRGEVGELLATARQMADSLQGLKEAVTRVLPQVAAARIQQPNPPAPFPGREGGELLLPSPSRGGAGGGVHHVNGTAVLEAPVAAPPKADPVAELAAAVLARLSDWAASANAGEDCPLPELFRSLTTREPQPTIGEFHDCLRKLHADGSVYLHPWTGPLYALPEPAYALLVGHGVAYYASLREAGVRGQGSGIREDLASVSPASD
jgi:hypothetical protein